jgi:hypothetical protein
MEKIYKIWYSDGRIFMESSTGNKYSRPLEAFPPLKDASDEERNNCYIWGNGEYIRWKDLDVDLNISNFREDKEPNYDNVISNIFRNCPWINISEAAKRIGLRKEVLDLFIYGMWEPTEEAVNKIKSGLLEMNNELAAIIK